MRDPNVYNVENECLALVNKHFPGHQIHFVSQIGSALHFSFGTKYSTLKNTPYFYNGPLKFVHWTTVQGLASIINNAELRMYNLVNSEDPEEFEFAAKVLDLQPFQIDLIRKNYFTFSFCEIQNLNDDYLWKHYGRNYEGVAIAFSIADDVELWDEVWVSRVSYEVPDAFKNFINDLKELKMKYQNAYTLDFDLWRLAGFHKSSLFANEKEVRISWCFPYNSEEELWKHSRIEFRLDGKRNRIVRYIPLKLWLNFDAPFPKEFYSDDFRQTYTKSVLNQPKIKIENVYMGKNCKLQKEEYGEFRRALQDMVSFRLGYKIDPPLNLFEGNM